MEEYGQNGWTIIVELLPLAFIKDNDVFNLAHAVDSLDPQNKSHDSEAGHGSRKRLQQDKPKDVHGGIFDISAIDGRLSDDFAENND